MRSRFKQNGPIQRTRGAIRRIKYWTNEERYLEEIGAKGGVKLEEISERRRLLWPTFVIGLAATVASWLVALSFPASIIKIASTISSAQVYSKLGAILIFSIPFVPPFMSVFAIGNLLFPAEPESMSSELMTGFNNLQRSNRRWSFWLPQEFVAH